MPLPPLTSSPGAPVAPGMKNPNEKFSFRPMQGANDTPWRLFTASWILFLIVLLGYLGLAFGYKPFLSSRIEEVDGQIQTLSGAISKEDQENLVRFYSQLVNFKKVFDKHVFSSKLFPLLERVTNKKVYFDGLDLTITDKRMTLEGVAATYKNLSEQLTALESEPMIKAYILNQSQLTEGAIRFRVIATLSDQLFK